MPHTDASPASPFDGVGGVLGVPQSPDLAELIGCRWPLPRIAAALNSTERAVYMLIDRHRIPYIKVMGKRYVAPGDIRDALLREQANQPVRGRGRPRKAA